MKKSDLPAIIIHAGAGKYLGSAAKEERARVSLQHIVKGAFELLQKQSAVDAVTWAITQLENDPQFNAGTGAKLQRDGTPRLTAALMDGDKHRFAGVINIEQVKNPILVSSELLKEKDRVLTSVGAKEFARLKGFTRYNPVTEETWSEWKRKSAAGSTELPNIYGTVGAVAADKKGRIAAATSTGGKGMEVVGRVSDSATVAGTYASKNAGVSATGVGEEIVEVGLALRIVTRVDDGKSLHAAFLKTFKEVVTQKGRMGAIGVDHKGNVYVQTTTDCILYALQTPKKFSCYP